jgi:two-component system CheB/CheR fusion protein
MIQVAPALPRRVLVVDDCRDTTASLSMLLSYWGHDVRTAHEGRSALDVARLFRPEVILVDIGMPGMSGFELARRLRQEAHLTEALMITISGFSREEDRRLSLEAGCDGHLVKPVEPELLCQLVRSGCREAPLPSLTLDRGGGRHE